MGRKVVKAAADKSIKHAVLWIRVSSREQKEGYSLDAQEDRLKNYCTQRGLTIVKQFTVVESSTRGEREEFYNMIAFIKNIKIRLLWFVIRLTACKEVLRNIMF